MPPKAANKRQYSAIDVDPDAGSSASEGTTRAAPKKKTSATKNAATRKSTTAKEPTVNKLYKDTVKAIEAHFKVLDGKVCKMAEVQLSKDAEVPYWEIFPLRDTRLRIQSTKNAQNHQQSSLAYPPFPSRTSATLLNCSPSQRPSGPMSTTQNTSSAPELDSAATDGSENGTSTTMTTEEILRARIKTLESQLHACREEIANLNKTVGAAATFVQGIHKIHEKYASKRA